jgi:DNA polymerase-3 subunit beta
MKITIDHSVIKALLICAAKQDVRYYLKGVAVDARADGTVVLVATDGHRMLAYPVAVDNIEAPAPGEYIIPREALEAVKPAKAGRTTMPIQLDIVTAPDTRHPEDADVIIKGKTSITITGATSAVTAPIDGKYPDWRRVVPASTSGELAQYQPDYVAGFGDICKLLGGSYGPFINHNGNAPAVITNLPGALGILMPMRMDGDGLTYTGAPAWARAV